MTMQKKLTETARLRYGSSTDATKLALAIQGSHGGAWELQLDPDDPGRIPETCELSTNFKALLGYDETELPDTVDAFFSLVLLEDRPKLEAAMAGHLQGRTDRHDLTYRIRHADGSTRWFRSCGQVVQDEKGRPASWVGIEWDITEHVLREEDLRLSQRKYATLFNLSPVPCALMSYPEGRFLEVNDAFEKRTGRRADEILGRTDLDLGLWVNPRRRFGLLRRLLRGDCHGVVVRLRLRHDRLRSIELACERLTLDHGSCVLVVGRDVTEELVAEERLMEKAFRDPLMGIPNRHVIEEQLDRMVRSRAEDGRRTAALFIDLDRLKLINDSLGHEAGDEVLATAARRLRQGLRPQDFLARFGGDELLALARVRDDQEAINLGERLLQRLRMPMEVAGTTLRPTASIGIALSNGTPRDPWDLVRSADAAMYRAKHLAGNTVQLVKGELSQQESPGFRTETDLHLTVQRGQLEVVYQPIVCLPDLALWGAEALVRWKHPERGPAPPSDLLPLAEVTGLIGQVDEWVLEQISQQVATWQHSGVVDRDFVVSVNLSARQLRSKSLAANLHEVLRQTSLPPASLQIEITEGILAASLTGAERLADLGVGLAIDNFRGSTLGHLRSLRVQTLKLDQSVTRSLPGSIVERSLVGAAACFVGLLGINLVAEGVETASQLRHLRDLGCPLGQGFLFADPLLPDHFSQSVSGYHRVASAQAPPTKAQWWQVSSSHADNVESREGG